jgi:hypothetical protein
MTDTRLIDLHPRWVGLPQWAANSPFYVGVSFDCPCPKCQSGRCKTCGHTPSPKRLAVQFWPPIDPDALLGRIFELPDNGGHRRAGGESFDTLTFSPSVGFDGIGHWHGHITKGGLTP